MDEIKKYIYEQHTLSLVRKNTHKERLIQATLLMDRMLMARGRPLEERGVYLNMVENQLDPENYLNISEPFGAKTAADILPYDVYGDIVSYMKGVVSDLPADYSISVANEEFHIEKQERAAEAAASAVLKQALQQFGQAAEMPMDAIHPQGDAPDTPTIEDAQRILTEIEEFERDLRTLVDWSISPAVGNTKFILDAFVLPELIATASAFGRIKHMGGDKVTIEQIPLSNICIVGGERSTSSNQSYIMTADDAVAIGEAQYLNISEITARYHGMFNLKDIEQAYKDWQSYYEVSSFNLARTNGVELSPHLAGMAILAGSLDWSFYSTNKEMREHPDVKLLVQDCEWRWVREDKYPVFYEGRKIRKAEYKEFEKYGKSWENYDKITYGERLEDDEEYRGYVRKISIVEKWEGLRIGNKVMYIRPADDQVRHPSDPVNTEFSFFGFMMPKTMCLPYQSENVYKMIVTLMYLANRFMYTTGSSNALVFDPKRIADGQDVEQFLASAYAGDILEVDGGSNRGQPYGADAYKHLSTLNLSKMQDVQAALTAAATLKIQLKEFYGMLQISQQAIEGSNKQMQGAPPQRFLSPQMKPFLSLYNEFLRLALSKLVNFGRKYWGDGETTAKIINGNTKLIKRSKDIPLYYYGLWVSSTSEDVDMQMFLNEMSRFAMSTKSIDPFDLIRLKKAEKNPAKMEEILKTARQDYENLQKQVQQQTQQLDAQQIEMEKVKLGYEKLKTTLAVEDKRLEGKQMELEFKQGKLGLDEDFRQLKQEEKVAEDAAGTVVQDNQFNTQGNNNSGNGEG